MIYFEKIIFEDKFYEEIFSAEEKRFFTLDYLNEEYLNSPEYLRELDYRERAKGLN